MVPWQVASTLVLSHTVEADPAESTALVNEMPDLDGVVPEVDAVVPEESLEVIEERDEVTLCPTPTL